MYRVFIRSQFGGLTLLICFLASLTYADAPDVGQLIKSLNSADPKTQSEAAHTLGDLGPAAKEAVGALAKQLAGDDPTVRAYAAHALGEIGEASQSATAALVKAVSDKDVTVRRTALIALRKIDAPQEVTIPLMIKILEESDPAVVVPVLQSLAESGKQALPRLKVALRHPKASYWACLVVKEMGPEAKELVPEVIDLLKHQDPECRMQALIALGTIGPDSKAAVPQIQQMLATDTLGGIRYAAAFALGSIGGKDAQQTLLKYFQSESEDEQLRAICGWGSLELDPDNQQLADAVGETLVSALESEDEQLRQTAVRTLAALAARNIRLNEKNVAAVAKALKNSDSDVVSAAIGALASHGEKAVPAILRGLNNPDLQSLAIEVVSRIGAPAKQTVPALLEILQEAGQNGQLRQQVHFALGSVGPDAAAAVPRLTEALSEKSPELRYSACFALGKIGPDAKPALRQLAKLAAADDDFMSTACAWAMVRISPHNQRIESFATPRLTRGLSNAREEVRIEMAVTLGEIGKAAKDAIPALKKAAQDSSPDVRYAANEAIKKIESSD